MLVSMPRLIIKNEELAHHKSMYKLTPSYYTLNFCLTGLYPDLFPVILFLENELLGFVEM